MSEQKQPCLPGCTDMIGPLLTGVDHTWECPNHSRFAKRERQDRPTKRNSPVGIECKHGYDYCPECDKPAPEPQECRCGRGINGYDGYCEAHGRIVAPEPQAEEPIDIQALHIAAQCWCDPETRSTVMDPILAQAFAKRLVPLLAIKAENAALKAQLRGSGHVPYLDRMKELQARAEQAIAERDAVRAELSACREENERLREALEDLLSHCDKKPTGETQFELAVIDARATLAGCYTFEMGRVALGAKS